MSLKVCVLASGSSGNATFVGSSEASLLVDAGIPATEITSRLRSIGSDIHEIDGILLTHAHSDHYRAAGTLSHRHRIPIFARPSTVEAIYRHRISRRHRSIKARADIPESIGDIEVQAFPVMHGDRDKLIGEPLGFVLRSGQNQVAVTTDLGTATDEVRSAISNSNALVIESNYDEATIDRKLEDFAFTKDWDYLRWVQGDLGHLSNLQCAELVASVISPCMTDVFLAHMSTNHNSPPRDNNSFELAHGTLVDLLRQRNLPVPNIHQTFRRGLTNGRPSDVVEFE